MKSNLFILVALVGTLGFAIDAPVQAGTVTTFRGKTMVQRATLLLWRHRQVS